MLKPLICGRWDGCSLWLQWNGLPSGASGYPEQVELRMQSKEGHWNPWLQIDPSTRGVGWGVYPVWWENRNFQARVGVGDVWELAQEVTFGRPEVSLEVQSEVDCLLENGTAFHGMANGIPCAFWIRTTMKLEAGKTQMAEAVALRADGYHQLDQEGDFEVRHQGVWVRNAGPTRSNFVLTGRDFTLLEVETQDVHAVSIG